MLFVTFIHTLYLHPLHFYERISLNSRCTVSKLLSFLNAGDYIIISNSFHFFTRRETYRIFLLNSDAFL